MSYLEKKVTELESDSLANSDLKSKLKQENTHLVHRQENTLLYTKRHYPGIVYLIVLWGLYVFIHTCASLFLLPPRVHELEEMVKDAETKADQLLEEEAKRHREAYTKIERDRNLEVDLLCNR